MGLLEVLMVAPEGVDLRLSVAVGADQALDGVRQLLVEGVARVEGCLLHKVVIKNRFFFLRYRQDW